MVLNFISNSFKNEKRSRRCEGSSVYQNISIWPKLEMNVYKVPSAVFSMNIFNIAEEYRFAHQYSQFLFLVNNGAFKIISLKKYSAKISFEKTRQFSQMI